MDRVSPPIPLETLLSFPFLWKPSKICNFVKAVLPEVRGVQESDAVKTFKEEADADANKLVNTIWVGDSWKHVLEKIECTIREECPEPLSKQNKKAESTPIFQPYTKETNHFEIISKKYDKKAGEQGGCTYTKRDDWYSDEHFSSVIRLFKMVRDKLDHSSDIPPGRHETLGWFKNGKLDYNLYIGYWMRHFPRLLTFLWWKFHTFPEKGDSFRDYFPGMPNYDPLDNYKDALPIGLPEFIPALHDAIFVDLTNGAVDRRFSSRKNAHDVTLEYRALNVDLLQRMLQGSTTLKIHFTGNELICRWSGTSNSALERDPSVLANYECVSRGEDLLIIVGSSIYHVHAQVINQNYSNSSGKIIIFTGDSKGIEEWTVAVTENIARHIFNVDNVSRLDDPVRLGDVVELTEKNLKETVQHWRASLHNEVVAITALLPMSHFNDAKSILSHLSGSVLNQLLKGKIPKLFKDHQLPSQSQVYLPRWLSRRLVITKKLIAISNNSEVFVFVDTDKEELEREFGADAIMDNVSGNSKIIWLDTGIKQSEKLLTGGGIMFKSKRVNVVRFRDGTFEWLNTHCYTPTGQRMCTHATSCAGRKLNEDAFVENLEIGSDNEKFIVIGNKPGMGKSQVLIRFAQKLAALKDRFVIFLEMKHFAERLGSRELTPTNIRDSILDTVTADEFDKSLLGYWFSQGKVTDNKPKVELLCDGLDEIHCDLKGITLRAINIILSNCPSVRVWATVRDHMLPEIQTKFQCIGFKLQPFTENDQIKFLTDHWVTYWGVCRRHSDDNILPKLSVGYLENVARKCFELTNSENDEDIAGIPLQCRMIAEIYERRVIEGTFAMEDQGAFSLIDLYEQMIERKLEVFMKEKHDICNLKVSHYVTNLVRDHMDRSHIYFALKLLFSENIANKFKTRLLTTTEDWEEFENNIKGQGLIQKLLPLAFLHRTFAEYIVARFVFRVLTGRYSNINGNHDKFGDFIWNDLLSTAMSDGRHVLKNRNVCMLLNKICIQQKSMRGLRFHSHLNDILTNTVFNRAITQVDAPNILTRAPLFIASRKLKSDSYFLGLIFTCSWSNHVIDIVAEALKLQLIRFCEYVIHFNPYFAGKNWPTLGNSTILHWLLMGLPRYFERINQCGGLDKSDLNKTQGDLLRIKSFVQFILKKDSSVLHEKDSKGQTPLMLLFDNSPGYSEWVVGVTDLNNGRNGCRSRRSHCGYVENPICLYIDLVRLFKRFHVNFNETDASGRTVLHLAIENGYDMAIINKLVENGCKDHRCV